MCKNTKHPKPLQLKSKLIFNLFFNQEKSLDCQQVKKQEEALLSAVFQNSIVKIGRFAVNPEKGLQHLLALFCDIRS